jgi:hypothetical protein
MILLVTAAASSSRYTLSLDADESAQSTAAMAALPVDLTAAHLTEFLRRRHSGLPIGAASFESAADSWTAGERRDVVAAAKRNRSIRDLMIDVDGLSAKSAKLISSIVVQLGQVNELQVVDSRESDDPPPMCAVDTVLAGIFKSGSTIVKLTISASLSASALLKVTKRYPEIEELDFSEPYWDEDDDGDEDDRDGLAMAVAVAMGRLPSLRRVALRFTSTRARVFGLLSALHTAKTIKTVEIGFPIEDDANEVVVQAAFVCACTRTIETVIFRGEEDDPDERLIEVSSLFRAGPSFSPSIKEVQFHGCQLIDADDALVKRAAKSLEHVESLSFFLSPCPFGQQLLERMPRLKKFSLVTRGNEDWEYELEYDDYSFLHADHDVAALCRVLNRKKSVLEDLEIELEGADDETLPSLARLLRSCKGRLTLKLSCLPSESCAHIVNGLERLRPDLAEVRLRLRFGHMTDHDYAAILMSLRSNRTLRVFECDVADRADVETMFAIHDLVESNATLQTLSFRELDAETCASLLEVTLPALRSTNRTLRYLELHGEDLADDWPHHAGPVLEMLQDNHVLSGIEGFDLPEDDPVAVLLKQNRYGRRFLHANDRSPIGIWSAVLANISHSAESGVMYKFLRAKPDLVLARSAAAPRPVTARGGRRSRKRGRAVP